MGLYNNYDIIVRYDGEEAQNYTNWQLKEMSHALEDEEVMCNIESEFGVTSEDFDETEVGVYEAVTDTGLSVVVEVYEA